MVTSQQLQLLNDIERGAVYNTSHTLARELIEAGLAYADWGQLAVSETGRVVLRHAPARMFPARGEHVASLDASTAVQRRRGDFDPMTAPHLVAEQLRRDADEIEGARPGVIPVTLPESKPVPVPPMPLPPGDSKTRALRAAGVASGATDIWPDTKWVEAFIEAFDGTAE